MPRRKHRSRGRAFNCSEFPSCGAPSDAPEHHDSQNMTVASFLCPSDGGRAPADPKQLQGKHGDVSPKSKREGAATAKGDGRATNGLFHRRPLLARIRDCIDGSSNTIAFGEQMGATVNGE